MKILSWLLGNWMPVLVAIVILTLGAYVMTILHQRNTARLEVAHLKLEIEGWKSAYTIISNKLVEQNKSIKDLEKRTKDAQKRRVAADKKAAPIVRAAQESEKAVVIVPASSGTCESELQTIKDMLEAAK
jgi:TPP-dependent trihydroxycyclohexane-1,2-dione (THcHDO) dehydratase